MLCLIWSFYLLDKKKHKICLKTPYFTYHIFEQTIGLKQIGKIYKQSCKILHFTCSTFQNTTTKYTFKTAFFFKTDQQWPSWTVKWRISTRWCPPRRWNSPGAPVEKFPPSWEHPCTARCPATPPPLSPSPIRRPVVSRTWTNVLNVEYWICVKICVQHHIFIFNFTTLYCHKKIKLNITL